MRIRLSIAATIIAAATGSPSRREGQAQKPPKPGSTTLKASAAQVTFSQPVDADRQGQGRQAGVDVTLERRAADETAFVPAGTAMTRRATATSRSPQRPPKSSVYRVTAATATSPEAAVAVAPLVGLKVSDTTPRKGQRVRFRGTVRPQHDGTRVAIQRKRADGTWVTVRTPLPARRRQRLLALLQAHPGPPQRHLPHGDRRPRRPRRGRQPRAGADRRLARPRRQSCAARRAGRMRPWRKAAAPSSSPSPRRPRRSCAETAPVALEAATAAPVAVPYGARSPEGLGGMRDVIALSSARRAAPLRAPAPAHGRQRGGLPLARHRARPLRGGHGAGDAGRAARRRRARASARASARRLRRALRGPAGARARAAPRR